MNKDEYEVYNNTTGEVKTIEEVLQEFVKEKSLQIFKKKDSLDTIKKKLIESPNSLTLQDIKRIADNCNIPIDTLPRFFMVSLSPCFIDLNLSLQSNKVFFNMLKLITKGHKVERYGNNKPIESVKDFYENLGITKSTFYRCRKELEECRLIKTLESKDSFVILFNPVFIRCGSMDSIVFQEFEQEIFNESFLEWLYFYKKFEISSSLILKNKSLIYDKSQTL